MIYNASTSASSTHDQLRKIELSESSAILTKTCTISPIKSIGNQRRFEYDSKTKTSFNLYNLVNPGIEYYFNYIPETQKPYIISFAPNSISEIYYILKNLPKHITGLELNVSCPNYNSISLRKLLLYGKLPNSNIDLGLKLRPYLLESEIKRASSYIKALQPNYIVCSNTIPRGISNFGFTGAVGGETLKPISLWNVKMFRELLPPEIFIIGCGGITNHNDVKSYFRNGAQGVQIGTNLIVEGTDCFSKIIQEFNKNKF